MNKRIGVDMSDLPTKEEIAEHHRIMKERENPEYKERHAKQFGIKYDRPTKEHELPYWEGRDHS